MKRNTASQVVCGQLINKADGTPCTSGTTTVYVTGDGGTQAAGSVGSGACTHEGNGLWSYAPAQAETNYDHIAFTFVNASAINATVQVYPSFPQTGDNYARLGAPAGASVSADIAVLKSETATIVADTNELQTDWANGGRLDSILDARASQTSVDDLPTNAELATALGTADDAVLAQVALVKAKTDNLPASPAATGDIPSAATNASAVRTELATELARVDAAVSTRLATVSYTAPLDAAGVRGAVGLASADLDTQIAALPTAAENADGVLARNLAGGSDGGRTVKDALRSLRNKTSISAGTLTVCEEDDSTPAWTATVTTTPGDPLSAIDPA